MGILTTVSTTLFAGTRVVSNQRGYLGVEPVEAFDPAFIIEV